MLANTPKNEDNQSKKKLKNCFLNQKFSNTGEVNCAAGAKNSPKAGCGRHMTPEVRFLKCKNNSLVDIFEINAKKL